MTPPLTSASDPRRDMPATAMGRLDAVRAAIASLAEEQRRLERLGFERPLARCHHELRYWRFLDGLFTVATDGGSVIGRNRAWPAVGER
ncbi:MAG: hypothetical protein ACHQ52_04240 [Candidatus Eisenbacteria bacterium]